MSRDQRAKADELRLAWAVVGVGVAGRARAAAIAGDPRAIVSGVWRGRFAAETGARVFSSLEEAIASSDAVAVCSPTGAHAEQIDQILDAHRHALVEFPLAEDAATAERLFAKARAVGRVLHEEHIELLDATSATLTAHIRPSTVRAIALSFEGPGAADAPPHALALGNVARLHRALAFAGPCSSVLSAEHQPGKLTAEIALRGGGVLRATFQMGPYFQRRTFIDADTVGGRWTQHDDQLMREKMPVTLVGSGGLFRRDQQVATARILDGASPYVDESRILHVMDIVDRLSALQPGPLPER